MFDVEEDDHKKNAENFNRVIAINPAPPTSQTSHSQYNKEQVKEKIQLKEGVVVSLIAIADMLMMAAAAILASIVYHAWIYTSFSHPELYVTTAIIMAIGFVAMGFMRDRYTFDHFSHLRACLWHDTISLNITLSLVLSVLFLTTLTDIYSRGTFIAQYCALSVAIVIGRSGQIFILNWAKKASWFHPHRYLIVGLKSDVHAFKQQEFNADTHNVRVSSFYLPKTFLDFQSSIETDQTIDAQIADLVYLARHSSPDDIVLLLPWVKGEVLTKIVHSLSEVPAAVHLVPDSSMSWLENPIIEQIGNTTTLQLARPPMTMRDRILKRAFDVISAICGILILTLPFCIIMLLIRLESKGAAFFWQRRHGFNENEFRILKFRTMSVMEDGDVVVQATDNDPRITRIGAFLRRTNLDEFPQLWNVLLGEMSLVGPRPHALSHNRQYEEEIALYARRHNVKPGITGWAQVNGMRGETETTDKMQQRINYDLFYIDNWSFKLDLKILFMTFFSKKAFKNAK